MSTIIPARGYLTIILSAELAWRDDCRNNLDTIELRDRLARQLAIGEVLTMAECDGAYEGTPERSFAITGQPGRVLAIAQREAERFGQESILLVNDHGGGALRFTDRTSGGDDEPIGHYALVDGACDAWTKVIGTGETFTFS